MGLTLTSLGGAGTGTGSKHLLADGDRRVMVDCGMFQAIKAPRKKAPNRLALTLLSCPPDLSSYADVRKRMYGGMLRQITTCSR